MSGTYTSNKNLNKPEHGGDIGTWGTGALNNNSTIIDSSLGNVTSISLTGLTTYTLTPGKTQIVNADGIARVWAISASPSMKGVTSINIASFGPGSPVLTAKQLENQVFYIYGTSASVASDVVIQFPFPTFGLFTFICNWNYAPIVNIYPSTTSGGSGYGNLPNQSVSMAYCVSNVWRAAALAVAF